MAKGAKRPDATSAKEINTMQSLTQQATAWLMGLASARTLRENTKVPRNRDGSYCAQAVSSWMVKNRSEYELSDQEVEQSLLIAEALAIGIDERGLDDIRRHLSKVASEHGVIALGVMMREILGCWNQMDLLPVPTFSADEIRRHHALQMQKELDALDRSTFETNIVCETCERVRLGHKWVKGKPTSGYQVLRGYCPNCEAALALTAR